MGPFSGARYGGLRIGSLPGGPSLPKQNPKAPLWKRSPPALRSLGSLLYRFVQLSVAISFLFQLSFRFSQLSVSFLYSFRCVFVLLAISKGFNAFSKKCGSFILDLDPVGVQFEVL